MTKTIHETTEKYFDDYHRNVRGALIWVYPTELRSILEKSVDLQIEAGKLVTKTFAETLDKFVPAAK